MGIWYVVIIAYGFATAFAVFSWRIDALYKNSAGMPPPQKTVAEMGAMAVALIASTGAIYLLVKTGAYRNDYASLLLAFLFGFGFGTLARWWGFQFRYFMPDSQKKDKDEKIEK